MGQWNQAKLWSKLGAHSARKHLRPIWQAAFRRLRVVLDRHPAVRAVYLDGKVAAGGLVLHARHPEYMERNARVKRQSPRDPHEELPNGFERRSARTAYGSRP